MNIWSNKRIYCFYVVTNVVPEMNNKLANIESLEDLLQLCWQELQSAASDRKHPMRQLSLATIGLDHSIEQRTVILRQVEASQVSILSYTDVRAGKVSELKQNPAIHYLAWHPELRLQIRLKGKASLHHDDEIQRSAWQQLDYFGRMLYSASLPPAKVIKAPQLGVDAYTHPPEVDTEAWRENFVVIKAQITQLECLVLGREKQLRASYTYGPKQLDATWLVP